MLFKSWTELGLRRRLIVTSVVSLNFLLNSVKNLQFSKEMSTYYSGKLMNQLMHIRNSETGKLRFFSKILATFELQKYLTFNINRYVHSFLTKLRLSAHSLKIKIIIIIWKFLPVIWGKLNIFKSWISEWVGFF
jgi:hypothetical protein